jgi:hypothetical protein
MRRVLTLALGLAAVLGLAGSAFATIDWAGNVWPNSGADVVPTGPVDVYAQVYKAGVTDAAGQGPDISGMLYYTTDIAPQAAVPMTYNTDVGNNDEYTAQIPQASLVGATYVDVTVIFTDETDLSTFEVVGDQAGNPPPLRYNVVNVLPNNVDVVFTLCMSGEPTTGVPCVIGSAAEIGEWVTGVNMTNMGGELWQVSVTFLAGGNPSFEYKYKKDDCTIWEDIPNRLMSLPTDGTTLVELPPDSWNDLPIGCGLGDYLDADRVVCFQVCMEGVTYTPDVCVIGSVDALGNWATGQVMNMIGSGLYQYCVIFPQGTAIPLNVEYKFKKDNCETWESVDNRVLTVDNSLPGETTVTHTWDDGPGTCLPVGTESATWGSLKTQYR